MTGQLPLCTMIPLFQDPGWRNCLPWDSDGKEKVDWVIVSKDGSEKQHMSFLFTVYQLKQVMAKPKVSRVMRYNLATTTDREYFHKTQLTSTLRRCDVIEMTKLVPYDHWQFKIIMKPTATGIVQLDFTVVAQTWFSFPCNPSTNSPGFLDCVVLWYSLIRCTEICL